MPSWVLILILITANPKTGDNDAVAVTSIPFAAESDCRAAIIKLGTSGMQSRCVKTGY